MCVCMYRERERGRDEQTDRQTDRQRYIVRRIFPLVFMRVHVLYSNHIFSAFIYICQSVLEGTHRITVIILRRLSSLGSNSFSIPLGKCKVQTIFPPS